MASNSFDAVLVKLEKVDEVESSSKVTGSSSASCSVVKLDLEDFITLDTLPDRDETGRKVLFPQLSPTSMKKRKRESKLSTADCFEYVASGIQKVLLLSKNADFRQKMFRTLEVDNAEDAKNVLKQKLNEILDGDGPGGSKGKNKKHKSMDTSEVRRVAVEAVKSKSEEPVVKMEEDDLNISIAMD